MIFNNIDAAQNELNKPKKNVENIRSKQKSIDDDAHDNIEEIVVAGDNIFTAASKRRSNASINNNRKDSIPDDEDDLIIPDSIITDVLVEKNLTFNEKILIGTVIFGIFAFCCMTKCCISVNRPCTII